MVVSILSTFLQKRNTNFLFASSDPYVLPGVSTSGVLPFLWLCFVYRVASSLMLALACCRSLSRCLSLSLSLSLCFFGF